MSKIFCRALALVLSLLLVCSAALAEQTGADLDAMDENVFINEEGAPGVFGYSEADALAEEGALDAFDAQPGDYEWYILPTLPVEDWAYVDIYPTFDVSFDENGVWTYSFTLAETTGIKFQPYVLSIICFSGMQEVRRDSYDIDTISQWWRDSALLCGNSVVYQSTISDQDVTAVALSIIGIDEYGNEQEFHSLVDVRAKDI